MDTRHFSFVGKLRPEEAFKLLYKVRNNYNLELPRQCLMCVARYWVDQDFEKAIAQARQLTNPALKDESVAGIAQFLAMGNNEEKLNELLSEINSLGLRTQLEMDLKSAKGQSTQLEEQ